MIEIDAFLERGEALRLSWNAALASGVPVALVRRAFQYGFRQSWGYFALTHDRQLRAVVSGGPASTAELLHAVHTATGHLARVLWPDDRDR